MTNLLEGGVHLEHLKAALMSQQVTNLNAYLIGSETVCGQKLVDSILHILKCTIKSRLTVT